MKTNYKTDWNYKLFIPDESEAAEKKERDEITIRVNEFSEKWQKDQSYLSNSDSLYEALCQYESIMANGREAGDFGFMYWMKSQIDSTNIEIKAKSTKNTEFEVEQINKLQFFKINLAKISKEYQAKFLSDLRLKNYKHFLEVIFNNASHTLTDAEKKIENRLMESSHTKWVKMVEDSLSQAGREIELAEGKKRLNFEEIFSLIKSEKNDKIRNDALEQFVDIVNSNLYMAECEMNAILKTKKELDALHNFEHPEDATLLEHDISREFVNTLVSTVTKNFTISQRFVTLKAKLLGMKKLKFNEVYLSVADVDVKYSFDEAVTLVNNVFENLDPEFSQIFNKMLNDGCVDVLPKNGKSGGAFCITVRNDLPTYIMLNFTEKVDDLKTLAHEFGHAMQSTLSRKQSELNSGYPTSTAEVSSTFMENFVFDRLLAEADKKTQLALIMSELSANFATIFRQVACYNFEIELHNTFREKGYLSSKEIGEIFKKHMVSYVGETVEYADYNANWWVYWPHIRNFFYVYSYVSGMLISKALHRKVCEDKTYILKVKEFLGSGSSVSPEDLFKNLGIDVNSAEFWELGLKEFEDNLDLAERLAKELGMD